MENFLDELKKYFETTSRDKILEDWEKSAKFDIVGPTIEEFLVNTKKYFELEEQEIHWSNFKSQNENINPKYTSGFFVI
jgi:hypothetical protein